VVAEHDVEAPVGQGDSLGAGVDQRHVHASFKDQPASVGELALGQVETDRPGAGPGQVD
jgi:hypothetical protein